MLIITIVTIAIVVLLAVAETPYYFTYRSRPAEEEPEDQPLTGSRYGHYYYINNHQ